MKNYKRLKIKFDFNLERDQIG